MHASLDAASAGGHTPVLYQNVLSLLNLRSGGRYIDGTVGAGGHAAGILRGTTPNGKLLGLDRDPEALELARQNLLVFEDRFVLQQGAYAQLGECARSLGWSTVDGVLLDLGLSSMQLDQAARGFSFMREGPLDMRFDPGQGQTAAELINTLDEADLREILWRFGEEPAARRIAEAISAARPLETTTQLVDVIAKVAKGGDRKIHPATRTFQALRIVVNDELGQLREGLNQALDILAPGGRLAIMAFHSLEDRIVKHFFREQSQGCICPPEIAICVCDHRARLKLITRRPIKPDAEEIKRNPRARSVKLRVAELVPLA